MIQGEINRLFLKKRKSEGERTEYADLNYVKEQNPEDYAAVEVPLKLVKKIAMENLT